MAANVMRNCRDCPARADCMASVLAKGPLYYWECEGLLHGWEAPATAQASRYNLRTRAVIEFAKRNGTVTTRGLRSIGLKNDTVWRVVRKLEDAGQLSGYRQNLPHGGYEWVYEYIGDDFEVPNGRHDES